jgi:uncharacterized protein
LLPLSSSFGAAAQRVYNGFDAAHSTDNHPRRPGVVFYDMGGEPSLVGNYVGAAQSDGADVVVGPLGKDAVSALLESREIEKPMVLLGQQPGHDDLSTRLAYQFDLAPETEARQVAEFMYAYGHRRAAALYPNNEWGTRIYNGFVERWEELGGRLARSSPYQPGSDDFTMPIKNVFNLNESETRKSLLEAGTGLRVEFDTRRRRDVDALFIVARPGEARLLKPQINFFQGPRPPRLQHVPCIHGHAQRGTGRGPRWNPVPGHALADQGHSPYRQSENRAPECGLLERIPRTVRLWIRCLPDRPACGGSVDLAGNTT